MILILLITVATCVPLSAVLHNVLALSSVQWSAHGDIGAHMWVNGHEHLRTNKRYVSSKAKVYIQHHIVSLYTLSLPLSWADRRSPLPEQKVKLYMYQLCKAIYHMHRNGIFHRDVKPENILIKVSCQWLFQLTQIHTHTHTQQQLSHTDLCIKEDVILANCVYHLILQDNVLKLADFGSCKSVYSKHPFTEYISTRWYRAPECLLTDGIYDHRMDMWSVGCVMYEIMRWEKLSHAQCAQCHM